MTVKQVIETMHMEANKAATKKNGSRPDPVPPCEQEPEPGILDEVRDFVTKYVSATDAQVTAMVLYAAATHALREFATFGRLLFTSDEEASGKTMAMMLTASLCANPLDASGTSYALQSALAAAGNTPEQGMPTPYLDEISDLFGRSGLNSPKSVVAEALRKGYKYNATLQWSVNRMPQKFSIFTPFLMAGLGTAVPRDIRSRSIVIRMIPGSPPEYFDAREGEAEAGVLVSALASKVRSHLPELQSFRGREIRHPKLKDRRLEVWEPLFAVAKVLGGQEWLNRCLSAFLELSVNGADQVALTPRQIIRRDLAQLAETAFAGREFIGGLEFADELKRADNPLYERSELGVAVLISKNLPFDSVQVDKVRGYYSKDIARAWEQVRPEDPEDTEMETERNPFEYVP